MKAAVFHQTGGPEVLRYEDVPDPLCPPDGVVIDVEVISVEGADTLIRAGKAPWLPAGTPTPYIVGYQCGGIIREVGARVTNRQVGDRVVATSPNGARTQSASQRAPRPRGSFQTTWT